MPEIEKIKDGGYEPGKEVRKIFRSSKTYNHSVGLSCCFRQWRASSHCRFMHGYALKVQLWFECQEKDRNGWVQDFGGLKPVKNWLEEQFDHKTLVAKDDPGLAAFLAMDKKLMQVNIVTATGCEAFAEMIFDHVSEMLEGPLGNHGRVILKCCEVSEHDGNNAHVMRA